MFKHMTLGQYYPSDSIIHQLDARTKIAATFMYIMALFMVGPLHAYIPIILFLTAVVSLSKVPPSFIFRGVKPLLFIILFTVSVHLFFTPGTELVKFYFITISAEGIIRAVHLALRLILLIAGSSLMTFTTTPIALTDGLERILKPLDYIGISSHDIAMMMTIALRFIPTLLDETDKIMKAQMARGTDLETGSIFTKAKNMVPIMVPLFISAFRRADELAMAMEARAYNGGIGRTRMKQLKYSAKDAVAIIFMCALIVTVCWIGYIV